MKTEQTPLDMQRMPFRFCLFVFCFCFVFFFLTKDNVKTNLVFGITLCLLYNFSRINELES